MSTASAPNARTEESTPAPRANPDLLGHEAAEHVLLHAYSSGRLFHAWMLTGPRGIGKATLAFRFARYVLRASNPEALPVLPSLDFTSESPVEEGNTLFVAPSDPVFRRVASGGHADLVTVERALDEKRGRRQTEIVVSDVRSLGERLSHTAGEGGWRVAIIDAADELNGNAANALLKVLEEPPPQTLMLLVCHSPGRVLPTIRSRCRTMALLPLDEATVCELLARYQPDMTPSDREAVARLSDGSIGAALSLAAQDGVSLYQDLLGILKDLPTPDGAALHRLADTAAATGTGEAFATLEMLLRRVMTRVLRFAATGDTAGAGDEGVVCQRLARLAPLDRWLEVWEKGAAQLTLVDSIHMDRKQMLLNVIFTLSTAIRK